MIIPNGPLAPPTRLNILLLSVCVTGRSMITKD